MWAAAVVEVEIARDPCPNFRNAGISSRSDKSVRVIATAIETSMLRWKGITAANRRESHASQRPGPLVLDREYGNGNFAESAEIRP